MMIGRSMLRWMEKGAKPPTSADARIRHRQSCVQDTATENRLAPTHLRLCHTFLIAASSPMRQQMAWSMLHCSVSENQCCCRQMLLPMTALAPIQITVALAVQYQIPSFSFVDRYKFGFLLFAGGKSQVFCNMRQVCTFHSLCVLQSKQ